MTTSTSLTQQFGTALRHTTIHDVGGGHPARWIRTAPDPRQKFARMDITPPAPLESGSRFVIGGTDPSERSYVLPGATPMVEQLLTDPTTPFNWEDTYLQWGQLLGTLHASPAPVEHEAPPARTRVRRWWNGGDLHSDPWRVESRALFFDELNTECVSSLTELFNDARRDGNTLVHGWAGFGQSVFDRNSENGIAAILGEDIGVANPEFDLGALLAQSVELAVFSPPGTMPQPSQCRAALLHGYSATAPREPDAGELNASCIENIVRHVADFTCFAEFDQAEIPRWSHLVNWLEARRNLAE